MALPLPVTSRRGGNMFETIIAALMILLAIGFVVFFKLQVGTGHWGDYALRVSLADAAGLNLGSDVRVAGTKVGSVTGLSLEQPGYRAIAEISIRDDLFLPVDTTATVSSPALGDVYLSLRPGHSNQTIRKGGVIGAPRRTLTSALIQTH